MHILEWKAQLFDQALLCNVVFFIFLPCESNVQRIWLIELL